MDVGLSRLSQVARHEEAQTNLHKGNATQRHSEADTNEMRRKVTLGAGGERTSNALRKKLDESGTVVPGTANDPHTPRAVEENDGTTPPVEGAKRQQEAPPLESTGVEQRPLGHNMMAHGDEDEEEDDLSVQAHSMQDVDPSKLTDGDKRLFAEFEKLPDDQKKDFAKKFWNMVKDPSNNKEWGDQPWNKDSPYHGQMQTMLDQMTQQGMTSAQMKLSQWMGYMTQQQATTSRSILSANDLAGQLLKMAYSNAKSLIGN